MLRLRCLEGVNKVDEVNGIADPKIAKLVSSLSVFA